MSNPLQSHPNLKQDILQALNLDAAPPTVQDQLFAEIARAADEKIILALNSFLSDDQIDQLQTMRDNNDPTDTILDWVEAQLPDYPEMLALTMLDIADELAGRQAASDSRLAVYNAQRAADYSDKEAS